MRQGGQLCRGLPASSLPFLSFVRYVLTLTGPGTGQVQYFGLKKWDSVTMDHTLIVNALLRARFTEICGALRGFRRKGPPTVGALAHLFADQDLMVWFEPIIFVHEGNSFAISLFLALLRQYTSARLKPMLAATGALSLSGEVGQVGDIVFKVRSIPWRDYQEHRAIW